MKQKKVIGYTSGVFDLFNIGHVNFLRNAKSQCDHLIVGVIEDEVAKNANGKRPYIPFQERIEIIRAVSFVDTAVADEFRGNILAAWECHKFDVYFSGAWGLDSEPEKWSRIEKELAAKNAKVNYLPVTNAETLTRIKFVLDEFYEQKINVWKKDWPHAEINKIRNEEMISFLVDNVEFSSVVDMGCGPNLLFEMFPKHVIYYPVDLHPYNENIIIRDLNKGEYFEQKVDVCYCSGMLKYIYDLHEFATRIKHNSKYMICSYHYGPTHLPRANNYQSEELISIFETVGFKLKKRKAADHPILKNHTYYIFE